jgi:triosephosphate isomerase
MRLKIVAGNWKMNMLFQEGVALAGNILENTGAVSSGKELIFGVPFTHLKSIAEIATKHANVFVAAQNCYHETKGAFTGEVSPAMLKSVGCSYVILGHSERRQYFNETEEIIYKKTLAALYEKLKVIYCCGEPLDIREKNKHKEYVGEQLQGSILKLSEEQIKNIVIAYEPIWAIGTGKTATTQQAQEMHAYIRSTVKAKFGASIAAEISILYGGSVKASNAKELFSQPDVDGGLVGGASLDAVEFAAIVNSI